MSAVLTRHRLTVKEFYKMAEAGILTEGDRVELINGELIDMPTNLYRWFNLQGKVSNDVADAPETV